MDRKKPGKRYVISDLHFGHSKMVTEWGRPADYEIRLWRSMSALGPHDTLICLGDVCVGNDGVLHDRWIEPLACRKWLVMGNHDRKSASWYLSHGWDFASEFPLTVTCLGKPVVLSHAPVRLDMPVQYLTRYGSPKPALLDPACNVHGHFHDTDHRSHEPWYADVLTDRHRLLACETDGYAPLPLESVVGNILKANNP